MCASNFPARADRIKMHNERYGICQIAVMLNRSGGTDDTKTFKPDTVGGSYPRGTTKTDRLEVTA
jgi:hypothetical protein